MIALGAAILFGSRLLPRLQTLLPSSHAGPGGRLEWLSGLSVAPLSNVLPSLSPYLIVGGLLGAHSMSWIGGLSLFVIIGAILRGRWFCRRVCPTGLLTEGAGLVHTRARTHYKAMPNIAPWLLAAALGSAAFGYPLFLWLDPLSMLHGFINAWQSPTIPADLLSCAGLAVVLALSAWRPHAWCNRCCPLGAAQGLLGRAGSRFRRLRSAFGKRGGFTRHDLGRRHFLAIGMGAATALIVRHAPGINRRRAVIRPPGAATDNRFNALCARCGNCRSACPTGVIRLAGLEAGWDGMLTPVLSMRHGYCAEQCHECNRVCPTSAIRRLTHSEKRNVAIGLARVDRRNCLAWGFGLHCLACAEACPYNAVQVEMHRDIGCPEVDSGLCRGCGLCRQVCPGRGPAIDIEALSRQRRLTLLE